MALNDKRLGNRYDAKQEKSKRIKAGLPGEEDALLPPPVEPIKTPKSAGRNDPCPCGSGKKYKKCCGK